MKIIQRLQHKLFTWFLYRVYSGELFKPFSLLMPGSKAFEHQYKEERYKIIESIQPDERRKFMKLMAMEVNYLSRKSHDSFDERKNDVMKGRIFQASIEYSLFDLVHSVVAKKEKTLGGDKQN